MTSSPPPYPDPALKCLDDRQMMLSVHGISNILIGRVVPIIALFGISGNILNLTVLLAKNMRTRSNVLLACLAVADVVFLLCCLPDAMANHRLFSYNNYFRRLYLANKIHLLHLLNWSSAAAIWLILVICVERLIGIRYPLSVRKHKSILSPAFLVSMIVVLTGALTFHYNVSYQCESRNFCNGTQYHSMCFYVDGPVWFRAQPNPNAQWLRLYVRWSLEIQAVCVVFLPVLLVFVSNVLLIMTMRQRARFLAVGASASDPSGAQLRTEQKVTLTVCAIVTCFTITQGPSAVIPVVSSVSGIPIDKFANETTIVTTMVVLGKALNFILFCLSSASFRQRLLFRTKDTILRRRTTARKLSFTASTRLTSSGYSPKTPLMKRGSRVGADRKVSAPSATRGQRAASLNQTVHIEMKPRGHSVSIL